MAAMTLAWSRPEMGAWRPLPNGSRSTPSFSRRTQNQLIHSAKNVGRRWVVTMAVRFSSRSASQCWRAALLLAPLRAEICDMFTTACTPASLAA